ncbi:MAG TPA: MMPL family transporter, partial [Gaiellaceae bacterium]|nr:MMPL family transporter [Gaiellaceae bacterium]
MTEKLARAAARHPKRTVVAWSAAFVVAIAAIALLLPSAITTEADVTSDSESRRGYDLMFSRLPPRPPADGDEVLAVNEVVIARSPGRSIEDPAVRPEVERLAAALEATGATRAVRTVWSTGDRSLLSPGGDATMLTIATGPDAEDRIEELIAVVEQADAGPLEVAITGEWTADRDFLAISNKDLKEGELFFGLPAALVVLLFVFGAVVASLVPLLLAIVAITLALALVAVIGQVWELSFFVVNMLTGMGLALGVDYALFVVSRFREERAAGREKLDAIAVTGRTASRAVLFSGSAFVIALTGMLLVPDTILRSLAAGAILVGITAVAAAMTLLPAVLSLLGDRVDALQLPFGRRGTAGESRFWGSVVARVQQAPVVSLVLATGFLVALALPALELRTGSAGIRTLPDSYASKQGFNVLEQEFGAGTVDSAIVVVEGELGDTGVRAAVDDLAQAIDSDPAFAEPETRITPDRELAIVEALVVGDSRDESAVQAIERLRADVVPAALAGVDARGLVTGETAEIVDYRELMEAWLPVVFLFVLAFSFVLLTVAFRSLVVPAKAIVLNLLSVGAAYGVLVLVFQKGVGNELFGFPQVESIEAWLPLFLFSVLFALSMDYHV